jgi:polyisoprenoid-binding protein YceI
MKLKTLASLIALTFASSLWAQAPAAPKDPAATPRIDQRQANQQKRIDQGVGSGALTSKETAKLEKREGKIEADKAAAKSDGKVTKGERRQLRREEDRASNAIKHQKHDKQVAAPAAK